MKLCEKRINLTIEEVEELIQCFESVSTIRSVVLSKTSIINCKGKVNASFGSWSKMLTWLGYKNPPVNIRYNSCEVCNKQFKGTTRCCSQLCSQKLRYKDISYEKKIPYCKFCNNSLDSERQFCNPVCLLKHNMIGVTVKDALTSGKDASKFGNIRCRARALAFQHLPPKCEICNYSMHVEVCHIKPLGETNEDTPLSSVNSMENLAVLCRNHHWELDNGILDPKDVSRVSCEFYEV